MDKLRCELWLKWRKTHIFFLLTFTPSGFLWVRKDKIYDKMCRSLLHFNHSRWTGKNTIYELISQLLTLSEFGQTQIEKPLLASLLCIFQLLRKRTSQKYLKTIINEFCAKKRPILVQKVSSWPFLVSNEVKIISNLYSIE